MKTWDAGDFPHVAKLIASAGELCVERAKLGPDDRVIDVACGSGNATIPAARTGATVIGLDITPSLLEAGKREAAEAVVTELRARRTALVTERPGRVRIVTSSGASELALTLEGVFTQSEAGLLGLALDPDFAQNRFVYIYYSASVRAAPSIASCAIAKSIHDSVNASFCSTTSRRERSMTAAACGSVPMVCCTRRPETPQFEPRAGRCIPGRQDPPAESRRSRAARQSLQFASIHLRPSQPAGVRLAPHHRRPVGSRAWQQRQR